MKYLVSGVATVSVYTCVEAQSEEEALAEASLRDLAAFHIDGSYQFDEYFHLSNDGTPYDLKVKEY